MLALWLMLVAGAQECPPEMETEQEEIVTEEQDELAVDEGFSAWYPMFQAAVASGDKEAVAALVRFPLHSWELVGKVPKKLGQPAEISRATFLKHYKRILDKQARALVTGGWPTLGGDEENPWYMIGVWGGESWTGWITFARNDAGAWVWAGTGGVSYGE